MRTGAMVCALLLAGVADAKPSAPRFVLNAHADGCPDERALRGAVARRLGRDPFVDDAAEALTASITADGDGLRGSIGLTDAAGRPLGRWEVETAQADCVELASALVLAISIVLDPPDTTAPTPPPLTPPSTLSGALGALVGSGAAPATSVGVFARISGGRGARRFGGEMRADLPRSEPIDRGRLRTWSATGALFLCERRGPIAACGLAGAGVLRARGEGLMNARSATEPMIYAGPRVQGEIPLAGALYGVATIDGLVSLWQTTFRVDGDVAWATPIFSVAAGLGLGARFW